MCRGLQTSSCRGGYYNCLTSALLSTHPSASTCDMAANAAALSSDDIVLNAAALSSVDMLANAAAISLGDTPANGIRLGAFGICGRRS